MKARQVVEGLRVGDHKSPYKGFSVEFVQHREYVPGDDIRHIDWKSYGRSERYTIKQYEQETNFIGHLLLDASNSMRYGAGATEQARIRQAPGRVAGVPDHPPARHASACASSTPAGVAELPASEPDRAHQRRSPTRSKRRSRATRRRIGPLLDEVADRISRRGIVVPDLRLPRRPGADARGAAAPALPRARGRPVPHPAPGRGGVPARRQHPVHRPGRASRN